MNLEGAQSVLFYGPRKAGTTLPRDLMDGGDELAIFPHEVKLHFLIKNRDASQCVDPRYYVRRSQTMWVPTPNLDADAYARRVEQLAAHQPMRLEKLIRRDMENLVSCLRRPPRHLHMIGMKEVGGDTRQILTEFLNLFPDGRVVLIFREPRYIVRSIVRSRRRRGVPVDPRQVYAETVDAWRTMIEMRPFLDDRRVTAVHYRNLVANTRRAIRGLCEFLGIEIRRQLEVPSILGTPGKVRTASREANGVFLDPSPWTVDMSQIDRLVVRATEATLANVRRWPRPIDDAIRELGADSVDTSPRC